MKFIFFVTLGLISIPSFAQKTINCPIPLRTPVIFIDVAKDEIKYDKSKTSRELLSIASLNISSGHSSSNNLLGLFTNKKKYLISPEYSLYGSDTMGYCVALKQIKVKIETDPTIFISREAQSFSCSKHRTEQHELLHYKFDQEALNKYVEYLHKDLARLFAQHFYFKSKQDINNFMSDVSQQYLNIGEQFVNNYARPLHDKIDSTDNYQQESTYCSYQENYNLQKLLEKRY